MKVCSFFGHHAINSKEIVREKISLIISDLINNNFSTFLVGYHGDFDKLVLEELIKAKKLNCHIEIRLIFTTLTFLKPKYFDYVESLREKGVQTKIYEIESIYYKNKITFSNKCMLNESQYAVFYVDESQKQSGAKSILKLAKKNNINYLNLFSKSDNPLYDLTHEEFREKLKEFLNDNSFLGTF